MRIWLRVTGYAATVLLGMVIIGVSAKAYSRAEIDWLIPGGSMTPANWESACFDQMKDNLSRGMDPRTAINKGGSYAGDTWVSARGHGASSSIEVQYGTRQIPLSLNSLRFLCSSLVAPDGAGVHYGYDDVRVVRPDNMPNDRRSNPLGSGTNQPAWTGGGFLVDSAVASDNGSVSLARGALQWNGRNDVTRYWFANPLHFTYTTPNQAGFTSSRTVTISVVGRVMNEYYGSMYYCEIGGDRRPNYDFNCPPIHRDFRIFVKVLLKYTLLPTMRPLNPSVVEPGGQLTATGDIQNKGPTVSGDGTNWRMTRVVIRPGQSPPQKGNNNRFTSGDPCSFFGPGAASCENVSLQGGSSGSLRVGVHAKSSRQQTIPDVPPGSQLCYALSVRSRTEADARWIHSEVSCVKIGKYPKVQVWGGDIRAGDPADSRPVAVAASISRRGSKQFGSWVEYGIFASGSVRGVSSASGLQGGSSESFCWLSRLSFTNATPRTAGDGCTTGTDIGGYVSGSIRTSPGAYFTADTPLPAPGNVVDVGALESGAYRHAGNLTTDAPNDMQIQPGKTVVLKVAGTVTIGKNSSYAGAPYRDAKDIPQLIISADAIDVKASVTQIDAWLVARGRSPDAPGALNTCSTMPDGRVLSVEARLTSTMCAKPLRVNGPVIVDRLLLRRTAGSGTGDQAGDPAEIFNLRPDSYLWGRARSGRQAILQTVYQQEVPVRL